MAAQWSPLHSNARPHNRLADDRLPLHRQTPFGPSSPPHKDSYMTQNSCFTDQLYLDDWCFRDSTTLPLTPPDTDSESATSDCQDMAASRWAYASVPEDYEPGYAMDSGPFDHSPLDAFMLLNAHKGQVDAGPASWTDHSHGFVDTDMSPSLSYTSQSSRSLNTIPDSENAWTTLVGNHASVPMVRDLSNVSIDTSLRAMPQGYLPGDMPGHYKPGYASQRRTSMDQSAYMMPRAGQVVTSGRMQQAATIHHQRTRPPPQHMPPECRSIPYRPQVPTPHGRMPGSSPQVGPYLSGMPIHARPGFGMRGAVIDPVAEDFSNLIDFPLDDSFPMATSTTSALGRSTMPSYNQPWQTTMATDPMLSAAVDDFLDPLPVEYVPSQPRIAPRRLSHQSTSGADAEDGRYRTDPLYSRRAQPDGLYHCPFSRNESCGHGPTKLKCNYDKYIDSHLKPFRCKVAECAKQAFSSTACLLRHEREAHGMHGHGHCPHLCPVPGCERSEKGKGFPRLYNCKDHMKRAHGIAPPSPPAMLVASSSKPPPVAKAGPRKRKASPTERVVPGRRKHDSGPPTQQYVTISYGSNQSREPPSKPESRRLPTRRGHA